MYYRGRSYNKSKQKYGNPFFPRGRQIKAKNGPWSIRKIFVISAILITLSGWFYLFLSSKYFSIIRIDVRGDSKSAEKAVKESLELFKEERDWLILKRSNIYLFPASLAEEKLKEQFLLQEIKITKEYPGALRVEFKIKKPALRLAAEKWLYTLDSSGEVLEKLEVSGFASGTSKLDDGGLPVITGGTDDLSIAAKALPEEVALFVITVFNEIGQKTGVAVNSFSPVAESPSSLSLQTEEGWNVIFNIRINASEQIDKLAAVLKEQKLEERKNLNYIDLRFGDRIFYK